MAKPIFEFSRAYLALQKETNSILRKLMNKELSLFEMRKVTSYLEKKAYRAKDIPYIEKISKKYKISIKSLQKKLKEYKKLEKRASHFKKELRKTGLKDIDLHPTLIHARAKDGSYIYIHIRKPIIVNFFPINDIHSRNYEDFTKDLEKKIKKALNQ
tara:strand:- start:311 stop:781 length:471 start_codon:yes stop_codon:yes gene_type:complete